MEGKNRRKDIDVKREEGLLSIASIDLVKRALEDV